MGGFAEDALVAGTVTRAWRFRLGLPAQRARTTAGQAEELGLEGFETLGECALGAPFYLFAQAPGDVRLDLGIADEENGAFLRIRR
jgi:hypothetical protein